jgi:hypothetical protein
VIAVVIGCLLGPVPVTLTFLQPMDERITPDLDITGPPAAADHAPICVVRLRARLAQLPDLARRPRGGGDLVTRRDQPGKEVPSQACVGKSSLAPCAPASCFNCRPSIMTTPAIPGR